MLLDRGFADRKRRTRRRSRRLRAALCLFTPAVMVAAVLSVLAAPSAAAGGTSVALTFDNGAVSQYTLGYLKALQPHAATATFFVNSGTITTNSGATFMTWSQVGTLAGAGNDIGGKSVNATNLTTDPNPTAQVCNDRTALLQHGLQPADFAYPGGTNNAAVQAVVKSCGYGNARTAGGLSTTSAGETLPPANWFATKAYAPATMTLAAMQAVVQSAASKGGGLVQLVIGRICDQTLDPTNYTSCSAASGHIELSALNAFLDWMGTGGGAPAGATLTTVRAALSSADTAAPVTTIACNGAPCSSSPYPGTVTVALAATDVGSSVAMTTFTTDGTDPTPGSPAYTGPFTVNGASSSTTVKFRSWDYAGNVEAVNTQIVQAPADTSAPTTTITCNAAACGTTAYVASVSIALSATDTGGSGVAATYYTTDGTTPTTSSTAYTAPFVLNTPGTFQVRYFSTDHAGNAEPVNTQQVKVVPVTSEVSLTFDNGTIAQYTLGYQQALAPHSAHATFFVNSATIGASANTMTWAQLSALKAAGNDIGGKTAATNLTTDPNPTAQVCNDRAALVQHNLDPVALAYPGGFFNASVEAIAKNCGYGNARTAGSLSPAGPVYAETLAPKDWFATRAYAPTGQLTLANMQALVSGAASHGGGWSQIVIGRVCSQAQDPTNYTACTASTGWIELADLNGFLDWMAAAGTAGGAPAGALLGTVRDAAISADHTAPVTGILCNAAPCAAGAYTGTVYVTLPGTDVGSAIASTHYTLDGSTPDLTSPTYTKPIPITATTTLTFRSYDHAGNAEAPQSQLITEQLPPDTTAPVTTIACDGKPCTPGLDGGYNGSTTVTLTATDTGGWGVDTTYYTIDGSVPTTASTAYTAPFVLNTPGTYTVQFFSTDLAGNAESVNTQLVTVLPPKVIVSLTFDDGLLTQYQLADQLALRPHHMSGTFFNVSGLNDVDEQHMTWEQLVKLNNEGNEIGGHTLDHVSLKGLTDLAYETHEVCGDRQNMLDHGLYPTSFAYPTGAYDAQAESVVQQCGYTSGRAAGGLDVAGDGAGPVYAETIPPKDPYATRTIYDPVGNGIAVNLAHLEASVTAAAAHGGGWVQFVFHDICSQQYDPANYTSCINDYGPIQLATLNAFLDWLQTSGQPNGAPPRVGTMTVSQVINGPDTQAPITGVTCDNQPCGVSTYGGSTTVAFASKDPGGSGVKATYYTTDGTTPTTSSPTFGEPFTINHTTTFTYFSVDNSGNIEPTQTTTVSVAPNADPVIGAAGDIACDPDFPAFNQGLGTATDCRASHTAGLLTGLDAVLALGDVQYQCSGPAAYAVSYDPTWGVKKSITHPVPGGEDYLTTGGTDCQTTPGAGYYQYFGAAAGDPTKGYYSFNLGQWHIVAINTAPCENGTVDWCAAGSQMDQWLRADLANNHTTCTLAYYQDPRWASAASGSGGDPTYQQIWQDLYDGGVDVALNGDSHWYERFSPLNGTGQVDNTYGVREFIVGTGGAGLDTPGAEVPTSQKLDATTHGIIKMTLHSGSYDWNFVPDEGTFTDSGTTACHGKPDAVPPTTTATCNGGACSAWYSNTVQFGLTAADNPGGSGVAKTYYTTNGTTPTTASPVYSAPIPIASTTTVKYFSVDALGNQEAVRTQVVQIEKNPPTTTIQCNGGTCAGTFANSATVSLTATDTGGSGVASTHYTLDGSTPSLTSPTYTAPFAVTSNATVRFGSWDNAGNVEAVRSQNIAVAPDAAPTTVLTATPTSGIPPLAVTADASKSTDTDTFPIKTYTYDWGDGTAPQTAGNKANHTYSTAGTYRLTVTVTDTAGLASSATVQVTVQANLATNSGFETSTSGWATTDRSVSVTRTTAQHHSGTAAVAVANTSLLTRAATLIDSPGWVGTTAAGTYTATLWVKAPIGGATLTLGLAEVQGTSTVGSAATTVQLTTGWQQVKVTYAVKQPGATALRLSASVPSARGLATAFYADDAVVVGP